VDNLKQTNNKMMEHINKNITMSHLDKTAVRNWVLVSDKLPNVEQNGNKVLLYRIVNASQNSLSITIYDTSMVKYCDINETWWMELPSPPSV
jgi:hypothetical protein